MIKNNFQAYENKASVRRDNNNNTQDKINNKIDLINKIDKILSSVNIKLSNKVKSIYESINELKDEIYDDPWLRVVELNKIKDILDDALNVVWYEIYDRNRINNINIDIDKDKDIDGYVSKLTDLINNEIKLINKICETITHVLHETNSETNKVNEIIHKASVMDKDTLHLIDDKLDKIIRQTRKKNKIMLENTTPKTNTSTPKINNSTPKTNNSAPKTKTNTSKPKTKTNTTTPKTNTTTPKTNTPKTNTSTPKTKTDTSTPKTKTNTTTPKTNTPKTNTPKTNTSTPKTNASTPKTNNSTSKTNDKVDIENHRSELHKTINNIKTILDCFVCEKFMNEKFITRNLNKDSILLCSINNSMKGVKIINKIDIYRDLISLITEKNTKTMKQDIIIYIDDKKLY